MCHQTLTSTWLGSHCSHCRDAHGKMGQLLWLCSLWSVTPGLTAAADAVLVEKPLLLNFCCCFQRGGAERWTITTWITSPRPSWALLESYKNVDVKNYLFPRRVKTRAVCNPGSVLWLLNCGAVTIWEYSKTQNIFVNRIKDNETKLPFSHFFPCQPCLHSQ